MSELTLKSKFADSESNILLMVIQVVCFDNMQLALHGTKSTRHMLIDRVPCGVIAEGYHINDCDNGAHVAVGFAGMATC